VLTADRPPELRDVGANQTIEQRGLYGHHARWFYECPVPDPSLVGRRVFATAGWRAAQIAAGAPRGPVHVNVPLREPLLPGEAPPPAGAFQTGKMPAAAVSLEPLLHQYRGRRGVVVAGATDLRAGADAVEGLAAALGWPVLADPLSNLRRLGRAVRFHDLWLGGAAGVRLRPEAAVRFGAAPVSKVLNRWLDGVPTTVVDEVGRHRDPAFTAEQVWAVEHFAQLVSPGPAEAADGDWAGAFARADQAAALAVDRAIRALPRRGGNFEGALWRRVGGVLAGYAALLVGNSMPVRDMDSFFDAVGNTAVFGQRGASGIDGVVSHGMGLAAALGRTLVVVGDLSFFHDLTGLLAAHLYRLPATVVVVNNQGGGIFSMLPQGAALPADEFEPLFGTPHQLDFGAAAGTFGLPYRFTEDVDTLVGRIAEAEGPTVLEWKTAARADNAAWHRVVQAQVAQAAAAAVEAFDHARS
jgi:2-succinyl-5-enolpyruvyl-6-hydroxy-3-cyclohexene-1-carboxylate synthase